MPSIGGTELVIILVFAFLLFGPDKLPQMGHTIGRALRQFRETQEKLTNVVQTEVVDPMAAAVNEPKKGSKAAAAQAAIDDEDADLEPAEGSERPEPRRKETFAERRARLAAEKAEKEAAAAEATAGDADAPSDDAAAPAAEAKAAEPADGAAASTPAAAPESTDAAPKEAADEEPELTTEDLYARRPRKHRAAAQQADAADETAAEGGEQ